MTDVFDLVERNMDALAAAGVDWSSCASQEMLEAAGKGNLRLPFFEKEVPCEWLGDPRGKQVLCLAGAGGLQAPLLAKAGAEVTVLDLSAKMLEKDRLIAEREHLTIRLEKGTMTDLSRFEDNSFDLILNPTSMMYVPDPRPVFRECARVLKRGGAFILQAPAPVNYLCDLVEDEKGPYYRAVHRMPYCSVGMEGMGDWVEYGHTMETYLSGQTECGFAITGYLECQREDITELYFMTRAVKTDTGKRTGETK